MAGIVFYENFAACVQWAEYGFGYNLLYFGYKIPSFERFDLHLDFHLRQIVDIQICLLDA